MEKITCTVIGDAMIDIALPLNSVDDITMLFNHGAVNVESDISPGGTANVNDIISKLGDKSLFVGKIGNDYFGKMFKLGLHENVISNISVSNTKKTGIVYNLILPNGDRSFIVERGANLELDYKELDLDMIKNSKYVYITGYTFQDGNTFKTILKVLEDLKSLEVNIVFNPGAPNIVKKFKDLFVDIIRKYVDIVILNKSEGLQISGTENDIEIIDFLLYCNVKNVVLTKGEMGSIVANQKNTYYIKSFPTKVVDTTGAGDAYAGSFIYGMSNGWREDVAGQFASKIASKVVERKGSRVDLCQI